MPIHVDDQQRLTQLRAELSSIGLEWHKHYNLVEEGPRWELDFIRPLTVWQFRQANDLLEAIMNSRHAWPKELYRRP
jgi:hypothetical protein